MKEQPPGQIKAGAEHDLVMMICTAGHVDHGKTSLVKQLTGCETDRLKVEKERGLTIELGFAPCMLRGNLSVGIVDVPGHEKFVKNMVAGVSGIDLAILVIAADDGIMPQTEEHLQIMELLGVKHGIVALTKIDLVSEERVELLSKDISDYLQGTFLENPTICPVSSETFDGFFDFYDVLVDRIKELVKQRAFGVFRMPVERVFNQQGYGTIVSGIPVDGAIQVGDQVELVPGGHKGKVRGIQVFGKVSEKGGYGQCLAVNIPDFSKTPPERGQVLCNPGYLKPSQFFNVKLKTIPGIDRPIKNGEEIKFHTGTSEETGKIFLLEEGTLGARQTGIATVALKNPVAAAALDRFIIRRPSPALTCAGGEILSVSHTSRRPKKKKAARQLQVYQTFFEGVDLTSVDGMDRRIEYYLCSEKKTGATAKEISFGTLIPRNGVDEGLARLADKIMTLSTGGSAQGDYVVHVDAYKECMGEVENRIHRAQAEDKALSLSLTDLRKHFDWPQILWTKILEDLNKSDLASVDRNKVILKGAASQFNEEDQRLVDQILAIYGESGFKSPRPNQLPEMIQAPETKVDKLMEHLCNELKLVRLSRNVVLDYAHFKQAQDVLVSTIQEKGVINSAEFKYVIDSTRKYALAILDFLDARRVTVNLPNHDRKLAQDYEKNLL